MGRAYKIRSDFDSDDAQAELERLRRGFDEELLLRFEAAARSIYERTQALVHVESGALKSTGKFKSRPGKTRYRAEISYGGQPKGVYYRNNGEIDKAKHPVKYARIEAARVGGKRHTGSHDWMRFVDSDWKAFEQATFDWIEGLNRSRRASKFKGGKRGRRRR